MSLPKFRHGLVAALTFLLLSPLGARAEVVLDTVGPFAVPTGSWTAALVRADAPKSCPIGTRQDCYFVYVDLRNASDDILDCSAEIIYENGGSTLQRTSGNAGIGARSSFAIAVVNAGAILNQNLRFNANCTHRSAEPPPPPIPDGGIQTEGTRSYRFDTTQFLNVKVETIANRRASGESGPLVLEVWLTPQFDGTMGYQIGEIPLGTIPAGFGITNLDTTIPIDPPPGTYYVVFLLVESGTTTLDRDNFQNPVTIPDFSEPPPPPPPPSPPPTGDPFADAPPAQPAVSDGGGGCVAASGGPRDWTLPAVLFLALVMIGARAWRRARN